MSHKLSWLASVVVAAGLAAVIVRFGMPAMAPTPAPDPETSARLQRLEGELPAVKRSVSYAGSQLGAVALARAVAHPDPAKPAETEESLQQQAGERAAKERAHYDELDSMVRAGGGAVVAAQVRKNVEQASSIRGLRTDLALEIRQLDCSDDLCRVEVRAKGAGNASMEEIVRVLGRGMEGVTMRPRTEGKPDVFYLAPAGKNLPLPIL